MGLIHVSIFLFLGKHAMIYTFNALSCTPVSFSMFQQHNFPPSMVAPILLLGKPSFRVLRVLRFKTKLVLSNLPLKPISSFQSFLFNRVARSTCTDPLHVMHFSQRFLRHFLGFSPTVHLTRGGPDRVGLHCVVLDHKTRPHNTWSHTSSRTCTHPNARTWTDRSPWRSLEHAWAP